MKVVTKEQGFDESIPGHDQMLIRVKLVQQRDTKNTRFSICHFLPNGHIKAASSPGELIYYCVLGKLRIKSGENECVMEQGDTVYIPAGEVREMSAVGFDPVTAICVYNP
jgi:quercetin dioxygenase-like cupin family protein